MCIRTLALALGAAITVSAFAGAYDDYVQLSADDNAPAAGTGNGQSFDSNASQRWKKNGVVEAKGPHAGEKYYLNAKQLCVSNLQAKAKSQTPSIRLVFQGDELAINGRIWLVAKRHCSDLDDESAVVEIPRMIGLAGGNFYAANSAAAKVEGSLEVLSKVGDASPFRFFANAASAKMIMGFDLSGAAQSCFELDPGVYAAAVFRYCGDASKFYGTIRVPANKTRILFDGRLAYDLPGTVKLASTAVLEIGSAATATIGSIVSDGGKIDLGSTLDVDGSVKLVLTNGYETNGKPIEIAFSKTLEYQAEKLPLLSLAAGAEGTLSADDFVITGNVKARARGGSVIDGIVYGLEAETDGNGVQTLYLTHREIVVQDVADVQNASSCLDPAYKDHWDDDQEPSAEKDYYSGKSVYAPSAARRFGGGSLTLLNGSMLYLCTGKTLGFDLLRLVPQSGVCLQFWSGSTLVTGKVEVVDTGDGGWYKMSGWNNCELSLGADLSGSGNLILSCNEVASGDVRSNFSLTGDNTAFAGKMRLWHSAYKYPDKFIDTETYCTTLRVAGERNLGGPMAEFTPDALSLEQHARLVLTASGTFDEPTRGWQIVDYARIVVPEGMTATVTNKQITYCGTLRKDFAGTLVLGGTAKFTADRLDEPVAGTNVLRIAGGSLTPASLGACDGLAIAFAGGTSLVLDAGAGEELRTKGLYDVKWDAPIAVEGGAALPVSFKLPADFDNRTACRLGICTVNATAAETMDTDDFAVAHVKGMSAKVIKVPNDDGTFTFACDFEPKGVTVLIR